MSLKSVLMVGGAVVLLYAGSVLIRAHKWEKGAEDYMKVALMDVANPWDVEKLERRASWGFLEKAKLKPNDIVGLSKNSLGNIVEIITNPKCNIQQGYDRYSDIKHTYAVCTTKAKFEKTTVVITIRLQDDGDWENGNWKISDFMSVN
ncbi:MAG TPA: hypothetical protein VK165_06485 [Azonexus sp.]|nr:hypothetical protein [Azonexus sp.]